MTREDAFKEINSLQDEYVDNLINLLNDTKYEQMKKINFTSPTGTGKTKMMSKLINKLPDIYFIVTTLSKGQLNIQIKEALHKDCINDNYTVYGSADYRINSKLEAEDIISRIPEGKNCIWLRDEGHIKTNRFDELLADKCYRIINFSATNDYSDINCSFVTTMMLRTVNQEEGTPKEAIKKLIEVKQAHKNITNYNPCAIFRFIKEKDDPEQYNQTIELCKKYNLKYIDITNEEFKMAELCEDDNEYDVIINKQKIVEGVDIRRAHILFIDNKPNNINTTIQLIGRCRRNALLYRDDIDILAEENKNLLKQTRECFVFYAKDNTKVDEDDNGELVSAFCDKLSCQELKLGSVIEVENGQMLNGLKVLELEGCTGVFEVTKDADTGFNIVNSDNGFYDTHIEKMYEYVYMRLFNKDNTQTLYRKIPAYLIPSVCKKDTVEHSINHNITVTSSLYTPFYNINIGSMTVAEREKFLRCTKPMSRTESEYATIYDTIVPENIVDDLISATYDVIDNNKESAIIGLHQLHYQGKKVGFVPDDAITRKITNYCKFTQFITKKYSEELEKAKTKYFFGKNNFNFNSRCNSSLGYAVEYYSKYLLFGSDYLGTFIDKAKKETGIDKLTTPLIIRACLLKYKANMALYMNNKWLSVPTFETLNQTENKAFISTIEKLGLKTAEYVKKKLYPNEKMGDIRPKIEPNLSIKHIKGLADFITEDTILDVKITSTIDEHYAKQILGYHYLSTKRSNLSIKRVIIYDAVTGKEVVIPITPKNIVHKREIEGIELYNKDLYYQ